MIRITRSLALLVLTALVAVGISAPVALAAQVTPWEGIEYNIGSSASEPVLIAAGTLPEGTKLPAVVELALPAGSTLQWAGEILGGDAAQDPEVATTKVTRDGLDIYTLTLTKSLMAQIEVTAASPVTVNGTVYMVDFSIPAWTDLPKAGVAIQIPVSAKTSEPTGTAGLSPGPTGFQYYTQDFSAVKKGDVLRVAFSYTIPTGAAAGAPGAASGGSGVGGLIVPIALIGLAAALGVALVLGVRRKIGAGATDSGDDGYDYADESDADSAFDTRTVSQDGAADADDSDAAVPTPAPRNKTVLIGTLLVVAAIVLAGIVAVSQGGKAKATGGAITKTLAGGEACTNATIALAFPEGTDEAKAAEQLFTALATVPSVTAATVQLDAPSISVGYCDSQATEDLIRQALAPTGYVVAASATTPTIDASVTAD